MPRSDARQNLIDSLTCATAFFTPPHVLLQEVAICFGGRLMRGNCTQKAGPHAALVTRYCLSGRLAEVNHHSSRVSAILRTQRTAVSPCNHRTHAVPVGDIERLCRAGA